MRAAPMGFGRCRRGSPEGMEPHGPHRRHEAYMRNRKTNVNKPPEAAKPAWSRPPKRQGLRTAAQGNSLGEAAGSHTDRSSAYI
jgi:hypothetical protein